MPDPAPAVGVIDLHLHTTASDGLCDPSLLVDRAWRAGIRTMSVTDHDTVSALAETAARAADCGIAFISGIEITAVYQERDIHVLGYYVDPGSPRLSGFLERQRADRVRRVSVMADRLAELGKPIDRNRLLASSNQHSGHAVGRPMVARALVSAGHVTDMRQAFEELIGDGRAAYVPRQGAGPAEVIDIITEAGGIASLAHPGLLRQDQLIADLAGCGLVALEAFHTDHDEQTTAHYLSLARAHGLAVSGGSDYHGEEGHRGGALGMVGLPRPHFDDLSNRARKDGR